MASGSDVQPAIEGHLLEQPALLLRPWAPAEARKSRPIDDDATGRPLGFACWPAPPRSWVGWLSRTGMEVFETEDASLLMTLLPPRWWSSAWEVLDAEDRLVGKIKGPHILDAWHDRAVSLRKDAHGGVFIDAHRQELGRFSLLEQKTIRLNFYPILEGQPFPRMLLLASVLCLKNG